MMIMKEVKKLGNMLIIDGKLYEPAWNKDAKDGEYLRFKLVKEKKKLLDKIDTIAERLSKDLNGKEVIRNALGELPHKNIDKLYDTLFIKKKKTRTRQRHGCYEMLVGGECIPLR